MKIARQRTPTRVTAMEPDNAISPRLSSAAVAGLDAGHINGESGARELGIEWLTKREMAKHFKCSERHINNLMKRRVLPYVKMGRFVRFDLAACDLSVKTIQVKSVLG